ncbi:MAG: presenilin family intramembrane aspartyl protease [Nanoarchaeota archaeon]
MKHSLKVTMVLLAMFFISQLIGLGVSGYYSPEVHQVQAENGTLVNITEYNLPYGMNPPQNTDPQLNVISIIISIVMAVVLMLILMKVKAAMFLRCWFFLVVTLAIAITLNTILSWQKYAAVIAIIIALPLAFFKIFKRNIIVHNLTELIIYPGIAAIFVPLLNLWTVSLLLVVISIYDIYAVWHAGFMQKMAKYQIQKLKFFSGFFIPYLSKKQRMLVEKMKNKKTNKIKVSVAILGGGDVVFPIILAGVVLDIWGFLPALVISIGAAIALALLFYFSEKGKFYPAMPFISAGCFAGLGIAYLITLF